MGCELFMVIHRSIITAIAQKTAPSAASGAAIPWRQRRWTRIVHLAGNTKSSDKSQSVVEAIHFPRSTARTLISTH